MTTKGNRAFWLGFLLFLAICGCSRQESTLVLDVDQCAAVLRQNIAFKDILSAINEHTAATLYQIDRQDLIKLKVYVSSGATAEEIAVFEAVDTMAAKTIEAAVRQRITEQLASYQDYRPRERPKLENPFVLVRSRYVIMCLSDQNERVKQEVDRFMNTSQER